ncbi:MAG TPA: DHA2 family efflux MFS transporter permease subunit [Polyangia bacterium]|nr:DHA2 family efflux MFS transporter permease subunit [Polyangia bacterium]
MAARRAGPTRVDDPRWALLAAILGSSMAFLDSTVVNVALPVMQRSLGATVEQLQWVVEAYALMLASLVLVGGALGDRLGRRKVFTAGVVMFGVGSGICGAAPGIGFLIGARAFQGTGAALLVPGSLALINASYPSDKRGRAIGTWSAWSAITAAIGPVAGGWVATHASWRWLFLFNLPIATVVIALAARRVAESRDPDAPAHLDFGGAALATLGLGLVVYALIGAGPTGLGSPRALVLLGTGGALLAAFVVVESRARSPMVPLSLFRSRAFTGANLLTLALYAALGAAMFFIPFNLIQVQGYSAAQAGAALLPFVVLVSGLSTAAGALAARTGPRPLLVTGPLVAAGAFLLLTRAGIGGGYWHDFFPAILGLGLGMGLTVAPLTAAVMAAVDARHAGLASGINNAAARTAGLLAIAALGVLLLHRYGRALDGALAALDLPSPVARAVDAQRGRLGGADFAALPPAFRAPVRAAFGDAYLSGFRALMLASAALAGLAAAAGLLVIPEAGTIRTGGERQEGTMLTNNDAIATVAVKDLAVARKFYEGTLGLKVTSAQGAEALTFESGRTNLIVYRSQYAGTNKATALNFRLGEEIGQTVAALKQKGVTFEHYDFPGVTREGDVHLVGPMMKSAWFKDPDGNIIALMGR